MSLLTPGKHVIQSRRIIRSVTRSIDLEIDQMELEHSTNTTDTLISPTASDHTTNSTTVVHDNNESSDSEDDYEGYWDIGDSIWTCTECKAKMCKNPLSEDIAKSIQDMLDEYNNLTKSFRMARDRLGYDDDSNVKLKLIGRRQKDARTYNLPTVDELAMLIVGDVENSDVRDLVLERKDGRLKRISELHPSYLAMQYPILFSRGEDGYTVEIGFHGNTTLKRKKISMREWFTFRIHERLGEATTILCARKLFHQFLVDAFTMIESQRLTYIRMNQKKFRTDIKRNLTDALNRGDNDSSSIGKRLVLPSSFPNGDRFMIENYGDAMANCKWFGFPDLFITFTCNPLWPEIVRHVKERGLTPDERPDIITRVFKIKLDQLINDIKNKNIFGKVQAVVYTVEFQKRGLPHVHIVLWLHQDDKIKNPQDIDKFIAAEIPDKESEPLLYRVVTQHMMHGPCGRDFIQSPCMTNGKCSKYFPKEFSDHTSVDKDGFPVYRRRDDGRCVRKKGKLLDNRNVVPYNATLLIKYRAHINAERCNQTSSIKYLFKYINKGHDRVTASVSHAQTDEAIDEIKNYYDCRYISACEVKCGGFSDFQFTIDGPL
ncbi:uncharacterized protein LOC141601816 [Silene latifolia]|uniref:uncharacterized protein LOC141601816 n=1 Tax=Silene latifolia TaxID=37657 RepID=UPI003D782544